MAQTTSQRRKTEEDYSKRGRQLLKRAQREFPDSLNAIEAFTMLCNDPDLILRAASTRTYKAGMIQCLKEEVDAGSLEQQEVLDGIEEISRLLAECRGQPQPRTSRKKCLDPTEEEIRLIHDDLNRRVKSCDTFDLALNLLLKTSCRTGIRPCELLHARVVGRMLLVLNGKHSHGRAPGATRRISLERMHKPLLDATALLLHVMKQLSKKLGSIERVCRILAERLARICRRLGLVRISLYSLRHVAIATWKRAGLDPISIAALAGHISAKTAWRHYARGKHGWHPARLCVAADRGTIKRVRRYMLSPHGGGLPSPWTPPEAWGWGASAPRLH